ncbi:hypothetical protein [Sphingomonas sp. RS2018]
MKKLLAVAAAVLSSAVPVAAMPEFTSWALMLSGCGGVVFMVSRRPQAAARIRFA